MVFELLAVNDDPSGDVMFLMGFDRRAALCRCRTRPHNAILASHRRAAGLSTTAPGSVE
jgi:hypothetical protein